MQGQFFAGQYKPGGIKSALVPSVVDRILGAY